MRDKESVSSGNGFANLLGHEAIHSVQVAGKERINFISTIMGMPYNESNPYELAAYSFGGGFKHSFASLNPRTQVFKSNPN